MTKIRLFQEQDNESVIKIFRKHWNDEDFITELSNALKDALNDTSDYCFLVAETSTGEIMGVGGFKPIDDYFIPFIKTDAPVELYVIAVKEQGIGVGYQIKTALVNVAMNCDYKEIVLFSPNTHNLSWKFHDALGFKRLGVVVPPDDDEGQIWSRVF